MVGFNFIIMYCENSHQINNYLYKTIITRIVSIIMLPMKLCRRTAINASWKKIGRSCPLLSEKMFRQGRRTAMYLLLTVKMYQRRRRTSIFFLIMRDYLFGSHQSISYFKLCINYIIKMSSLAFWHLILVLYAYVLT
jgi:hypothetical protein